MFNFTADGETLIDNRMLNYINAILTEGHYAEIVTNATITKTIDELCKFPKHLLERLMLKCSFHYLELKGKGLLDVFFANVHKFYNAGGSFTVELMPTDELLPLRDEIYDITMKELGAPCHLTVGRDASQPKQLPLLTKLSAEEFKEAWKKFDSKLFEYKLTMFNKKRHEFCYAGEWMAFLNLQTGDLSQCYTGLRTINVFKSIDKPLNFKAIGKNCCEPHCYNAHAWLTFGCIPDTPPSSTPHPYYDEVRNRKCIDGSEWLRPKIKRFFHQKFAENNEQYSSAKTFLISIEMTVRKMYRDSKLLARSCIETLFIKK